MNQCVLSNLTAAFVAFVLSGFQAAEGSEPSVEELLRPLAGGSAIVEQPEKVRVEDGVITAATAQDAVNAAVASNKEAAASREVAALDELLGPEGMLARLVQFPSGLGVVATGVATYVDSGDIVVRRISQRHAYVVAFTQAKQHMAAFLNSMSHEGQEALRQQMASLRGPADHLNNVSSDRELTVKQALDRVLRAFVMYEVVDNPETRKVFVSIVTSPRTCQTLSRSSATAIEAASLHEGLTYLLDEVRTGVAYPIGCRIIAIPATGETAVVGFGSQVVQTDENEAVEARLRLDAQKAAAAFARDSLTGMLIGDRLSWEGRYSEQVRHAFQAFEDVAQEDGLAPLDPETVRRLDRQRQTVVAEARVSDIYRSGREGQLPPGVVIKTWFNNEGSWVHGIAVYLPSVTREVVKIGRRMQDARLIEPYHDTEPGIADTPSSSGPAEPAKPSPLDRRPAQAGRIPLSPGPTGRVDPKDL